MSSQNRLIPSTKLFSGTFLFVFCPSRIKPFQGHGTGITQCCLTSHCKREGGKHASAFCDGGNGERYGRPRCDGYASGIRRLSDNRTRRKTQGEIFAGASGWLWHSRHRLWSLPYRDQLAVEGNNAEGIGAEETGGWTDCLHRSIRGVSILLTTGWPPSFYFLERNIIERRKACTTIQKRTTMAS